MLLALGLVLPVAMGFVISLVITPEIAIVERIAVAYGLGYGFLTLGMFFLNVLGIRFSLINTTALLSGILVLSLVYLKWKNRLDYSSLKKLNPIQRKKPIRVPPGAFEKIIIALLVFFAVSNLVIALYWPVRNFDAVTTYDFRARVFAETKFIPEALQRIRYSLFLPHYATSVFPYPPLTSLVHTWLYLSGWSSPKIFYPLLLISLATIFYFCLRDYSPRYHCLLFTLVLMTIPFMYEHATSAYTNFPSAFYFGVGALYLYRWMSTQKRGFLALSGLLFGLSSWVRRESLLFFLGYLVILAVYSISHRQFFAPLLFALPYFSMEFLWGIYTLNVLDIRSTIAIPYLLEALRRWHEIFDFVRWKEVAPFLWSRLAGFRILIFLLVPMIFLYLDRIRQHIFLFLMVLSNLALFVAGSYFFIAIAGWLAYGNAPTRLFMMFLPIICFFAALVTTERSFLPRDILSKEN